MQTAMLDENVARPITQRFDARTTAEAGTAVPLGTYRPAAPAFPTGQAATAPARSRRGLLTVALILLILLGAGALFGVMKRTRQSNTQTQVSQQFRYPGARTSVNVGSESGAVLQMETTDPLDKVAAWYESTLKPTKTIRVTAIVLIMKNDKVTATLAATGDGTTIVIKQSAP